MIIKILASRSVSVVWFARCQLPDENRPEIMVCNWGNTYLQIVCQILRKFTFREIPGGMEHIMAGCLNSNLVSPEIKSEG